MLDYTLFNNEEEQPQVGLLKKTRAKIKSPGGVLSTNVQPGQGSMLPNAIDSYRSQSKELSDRAFAAMDAPVDYSAMQQMARDRTAQGEGAMLNALAAQFAGEQFAPVQQQLLKRASAAREPIKMAGGLITPEGNFVKDPEAARDKEVNMLLQRSAELSRIAETADTARERIAAQRAQNELQNQMRLIGLDLQRQGLAMRSDSAALQRLLAGQAVADRKERSLNEGTQKLSKQAQDFTGLYAGISQLNDRLSGYAGKSGKIPGIGLGANMSIAGLNVSSPFIGEEGRLNRAMAQNVLNQILAADSGMAVTTQEAARQLLASMNSPQFTENDFMNAWENNILPRVNASFSNIGAGYSPEVKQRYRDQGGKINFDKPFTNPRGDRGANQAGAAKVPAGIDPRVWSAMTPEERSLWK